MTALRGTICTVSTPKSDPKSLINALDEVQGPQHRQAGVVSKLLMSIEDDALRKSVERALTDVVESPTEPGKTTYRVAHKKLSDILYSYGHPVSETAIRRWRERNPGKSFE